MNIFNYFKKAGIDTVDLSLIHIYQKQIGGKL